MRRRFLSAFGSLFLLVSCGSDDKMGSPTGPDSTMAPAPRTPAPAVASGAAVDPAIPAYEPTAGVAGTATASASDAVRPLVDQWAEALSRAAPGVKLEIATAEDAALVARTRPLKPSESEAFEKKHGAKALEIRAALDALVILVHKDNPLDKLTIAQADAIFGRSRKQGAANDVRTWGELGLKGDWAARAIGLYGRRADTDDAAFLKERVLKNGEPAEALKEQATAAALVQAVSSDLYGIGYGSLAEKGPGVKVVPLVAEDGHPSPAGQDDLVKGSYPLARFVLVYASQPTEPAAAELLKFVLSRQGQEVAAKNGRLPLPASVAQQERAKLP